MGVRITRTTEAGKTVIRVDGQLSVESVPELRRECQLAEVHFVLGLSGLLSADNAGLEILRELASDGAELRGASTYVQMLLDSL
jgi:hypothetical protein